MSMPEAIDAAYISQTRSHTASALPIQPGYELLDLTQAQEPTTKRSRARMLATLTGLYLSLFIAALDQTIIATAIPTISASLHSSSGFVWIGGAYLLASAAAGPIWAKLSDIWGRKPILLVAVAWFCAGSVVCGTAVNMVALVVGRAFQGVAGGGLMQLVNITLSDIFSMRSRTIYFGLLELMWAIAGGTGPLLGGAFAERLSWRWAFYINLPVCALTFILLLIYLDVHNPRTRAVDGLKAIDWAGSVTMLAVTLMVLIGLNFGGTAFPWSSPKVIALLIVGSFMSLAFVVAEKKFARYPLIPLALFRDRSNLATLAVVFCHGMVFLGAEYYLPLYFQAAQLASPLRSGALVLPFVVSEALAGIATGVFMHQVGRYREPMWLGMTVLVAGFALFTTLGPLSSFATIVGFQVLAGAAAGLIFSPPIVAVQALMEQHDVAAATATLGFVRNVACAMSTVIGGVVFTNGIAEQKQRLMAVGLNATAVEAFSGRDAEANVLRIASIGDPRQRLAVQDAYAQSLRNCWIMYTCLAGVGVIASFFIRKAILSSEHVETKTGLRQKDEAENTRAERV